jgi:uncharacterized protein YcfJ
MKQYILPIMIIFASSAASADGLSSTRATVVDVETIFRTEYTTVVQEQCYQQQVPVYGYNQPSTGDVLAGAIIGGAIGNQFGSGSGNDAMTVLGAIVGADVAGRGSNGVVGYANEWHCQMVEVPQQTQVFDYYIVTYERNGRYYQFTTVQTYEIGQRIKVKN